MSDYIPKDPSAVLDYSQNWASKDGTNDGSSTDTGWLQGDTISTSTWTVSAGITKDSDTNTAKIATIWLSGGTDGTDYTITNHIVTAAGREDDRSITIKVGDR